MNLEEGMNFLVYKSRMLSGLSVTYGTESLSETFCTGNARELLHPDDSFESPVPLEESSIFDLASLTKCFTSVLAFLLIREHRLDPDASPFHYEPRFIHLTGTTIMDVLTFNVGLTTAGRIDDASSPEDGLHRLYQTVCSPPPRIRLYSDIPAMIIARIIESVSGMSYMSFLRERILKPLGMNETTSTPDPLRCVDYRFEHRLIDGSLKVSNGIPGIVHDPKAALLQPACLDCCGHAGLFSTRQDMQRFAQALLGGELLTSDELRLMGTNHTGFAYPDGTYRQFLGCLCFSKHPNQRLSELPSWMSHHAVGLSGFTGNHLAIDPDTGTFILYLGNRVHHRLTRILPFQSNSFASNGLNPDGTGCIRTSGPLPVPSSVHYVYFKDHYLGIPIGQRMRELGWL